MKKRFLLAGLFAVSALMTACSDDDRNDAQAVPDNNPVVSNPVTNPGTQALVLHGVANGDVTTQKTALADDGKAVVFTDGDKVSVFDGALINCEFASEIKDEGASADFTGTISESATEYYVLYPYQDGASISVEKVISATLPATQTATLNSFDPKANLSVAVCNDAESFSLRNIGSLLKLTTTEDFDKIVVKSNNGEKIAGAVTITIAEGGIPTVQASDAAVSEISLVPAADAGKIAAGTYYVAMLSGVYTDGITVELYKGNDVYTKLYKKELSFVRSKGLNATMKDFDYINFDLNGVKFKMIGISGYRGGYFYMAETETTQALWQAVMGNNPSWADDRYYKGGIGNDLPVNEVGWRSIHEGDNCFLTKLNAATSKNFRLPSSDEWEYAAKGGDPEAVYSGCNNDTDLGDYAWYSDNIDDVYGCREVATKKANGYGLYDMSGNVWEWCEDDLYSGSTRVIRGGYWYYNADHCRVSFVGLADSSGYSSIGFRLALSL